MNSAAKAAIWVAAITAVGGVITAVAVALINRPNEVKPGGDITSTPTQAAPKPTPPPTTKSPAPAPFAVTLDSVLPRGAHKSISSKEGLAAKGTVKNLPPGYSIWLMDRDDTDYSIAQSARISNETWIAESYPLGDPSQAVPYHMTVVVVRANGVCTSELRKRVRQDKYQMTDLPKGCAEAAQQDITVSEK
ncbi:hypothetical protein ACFTSF_15850 [Kribbella sp. NPDC056951]|uniref:hypothetical protein n=1 Tax=Kribbella sp. NPDC056951 TaxID=3345978 RepID=UPI00363869C8